MKVVNVYEQYFHADAKVNGVVRHAAIVGLQAESDEGRIVYRVFVNFFPYSDPEDFAVSGDAYREKVIYEAKGRRSRKREEGFLNGFRKEVDEMASEMGGVVFWDNPLRDARMG